MRYGTNCKNFIWNICIITSDTKDEVGRHQDDRMTFYWWTLATISSGCQHQTQIEKVEILFENQIQI